jgi:excisionase family DNA binding protein
VPRTPTDWISLAEASEMLSAAGVPISTSTLARWARDGRLQHIRPGRRVYVRRAQVRALLTPRRGVRVDPEQAGLFEDQLG